eukprot:m.15860 g.15860  ORF g.15860 m.15860 type:complete len:72 (-) comp6806_c0_seq1:216-431(-)
MRSLTFAWAGGVMQSIKKHRAKHNALSCRVGARIVVENTDVVWIKKREHAPLQVGDKSPLPITVGCISAKA